METMHRKWYKMNVDILIDNLNSIHYRYVDSVVAIVLYGFKKEEKNTPHKSNGGDKNLRTLTDNNKSHVKEMIDTNIIILYLKVIGR